MRYLSASASQTEALGARLAQARPPGQDLAVLYLCGALGAGKTTLARGFLRACGVGGPIRSPTYSVLEPHVAGELTLVHIDLYRLHAAEELENLGLRDYAHARHVWLVEWPERGGGFLPAPDLQLEFSVSTAGHAVELTPHSGLGSAWLAGLAAP